MKAHLLFEQSGTFKRAFMDLGIEATDYDIENKYNQTDVVVDLFTEIEAAYTGGVSVLDQITPQDIVMAFFPCTNFSEQSNVVMRCEQPQEVGWSQDHKLEYSMAKEKERSHHYQLICKLVLVAIRRGWRVIIENPYGEQHYLRRYWPIRPAVIDKDRRLRGDYYRKPTQYFFIGMEPKNRLLWEPMEANAIGEVHKINGENRQMLRSLIAPEYASRFIREYIL